MYSELVRHAGNRQLFQAVEMSLIALANEYPFHIHAEGLRGTGKTTIMRAVKNWLPPIIRLKNCIYNCHPDEPHCPEHAGLSPVEIAKIGTEKIPMPFLEISHSAKIGTVVGSINLGKLTDSNNPSAVLLPGTLPQAHRGIVFIDEINRLADTSPELADILLDVMGTKPGRIQLEETGLATVGFPINVAIWAASNPDEDPGALSIVRRQLSDRFDMLVKMGRPSDYQDVMAVLERSPKRKSADNFEKKIMNYCSLSSVTSGSNIKNILASIYIDFGLESLRSVEALQTAASLNATIQGNNEITIDDLITVVPLVLEHRTDQATIAGILRYLQKLKDQCSLRKEQVAGIAVVQPHIEEERTEKEGEKSWLKVLMAKLRSMFSFNKNSNNSVNGNHKDKEANAKNSKIKKAHTDKRTESQVTEKNSKIANPLETQIIAPVRTAIPLAALPVEQFVSSEDSK